MTERKILPEPCPDCKGQVIQTYFSADCRGNSASTHIECDGCGREYSVEDWANIEIAAVAEKKEKRKKKKPPVVKMYETYKVTRYSPGMAEIEFFDDSGFVPLAEVERAIKKHLRGCRRENLYFLISDDTGRLTIGPTD